MDGAEGERRGEGCWVFIFSLCSRGGRCVVRFFQVRVVSDVFEEDAGCWGLGLVKDERCFCECGWKAR